MQDRVVILADGEFPVHKRALAVLKGCRKVICCDGAAAKLISSGIRYPDYVVGDLDSLLPELLESLGDRVVRVAAQDTNDLTKAFDFAVSKGFEKITILGATGLREDHTLGNISLLMSYSEKADVEMLTNFGRFVALRETTTLASFAGQQVSIFSLNPDVPLTFSGLKWDIENRPLKSWWEGTLNEAVSDHFTVSFEGAAVVVFQTY